MFVCPTLKAPRGGCKLKGTCTSISILSPTRDGLRRRTLACRRGFATCSMDGTLRSNSSNPNACSVPLAYDVRHGGAVGEWSGSCTGHTLCVSSSALGASISVATHRATLLAASRVSQHRRGR